MVTRFHACLYVSQNVPQNGASKFSNKEQAPTKKPQEEAYTLRPPEVIPVVTPPSFRNHLFANPSKI